jgi:outer membrane protein assembly factor BamB
MGFISFWFLFAASNLEIAGIAALVGLAFLWLGLRMRRRALRREARRRANWSTLACFGGFLVLFVVASIAIHPRYLMHVFRADYADAQRLAELRDAPLPSSEAPEFPAGEWPQWRGPARDGVSRATSLLTDWAGKKPPILWKQPLGKGYSSIAVAHGRLYTMDRRGAEERVVCLDAATGKDIWNHAYQANFGLIQAGERNTPGPRATPTVYDGRIYTVGAVGKFLCLEATAIANAAKVLWQHDLAEEYDLLSGIQPRMPAWGIACSPLIEGELVIVQPGGESGSIVAFDRRTGEVRWRALADVSGYSSPIAATVAGVRQIIAMTGDRSVGLRAADGTLLWSYEFATGFHGNIATPIVAGNYVFISADYGTGCAMLQLSADGQGGVKAEPVYFKNNKLMRNHHSTCVLRDGFLFGFDKDFLKCVDLRTGEEKWNAARQVDKGSVVCAGDHLVVLTQNGLLVSVAATPEKFVKKGEMQVLESDTGTTWAVPALADGRLYLRDGTQIVCIDLRK